MGQIINYKNEGAAGVYCQIKLDSGERVLISIAADEIKIFKMRLGGLIPGGTVWEYPDVKEFAKLTIDLDNIKHPLDILLGKVQNYSSINELQQELDKYVNNLKRQK